MLLIKILAGLFLLDHQFAGSASKTNQTISELILSATDNLCPYSRICERFDGGSKASSQTVSTNEYVPCCGACSCEVDCGKIGKCCFSGENNVSGRQNENYAAQTDRGPESEYFNSSCLFPGTKRSARTLYRHYEMIDTCPFKKSTKEHDLTQNQFPERCGDVTVVWDTMFPVYSPSTKRLYKNSVCSRCHQVTDGVVWDMSMTCLFENKSKQLKFDISEVLNIDQEKQPESLACVLTFSFPGNWLDIEHVRCITEPLVDTCSRDSFEVPANINMTPAEVVDACESGFYSPIFPSSTSLHIFANVFCSICNSDYDEALTMCSNPNTISRDSGQLSFILRGTEIRDKYVDIQKTEKGVRIACLDMPHSSNLKRQDCRRIYCRTGHIQDPAGECKHVSVSMFTTYEMTIDLIPRDDIPIEFVKSGINSWTNSWLNGPFSTNWRLLTLFLEPYIVQGKYIIKKFIISLRIKTSMSFESLLKNVKRLMKRHWYATLNGTTFELGQELSRIYDFSKLGQETYCTNSPISKEYEPICDLTQLFMPLQAFRIQSLIITKMVFCEQVELRDSEYDVIVTKKVIYYRLRNLTLFEGEFVSVYHPLTGNYTVRLCLADAGFKIFYYSTSASFPIRNAPICSLTLFLMFSSIFLVR